jgi:hypothetical protein
MSVATSVRNFTAVLSSPVTDELLEQMGLPNGLCVRRQELCARSLHEAAAGVIQDQEYEKVMAPLLEKAATTTKSATTATPVTGKRKPARKTRRGTKKAGKRTRRRQ